MNNIEDKTVASFGDEWSRFDQFRMSEAEALKDFDEYFSSFTMERISTRCSWF